VAITNNTIANNEYGIVIWNAPFTGRNGKYVTVHSNNLTNNGNGVYIVDSSNVIVHSNSIKSTSCGVFVWQSPRKSPLGILLGEITVINNNIGDGDVGIYCYDSCPLIQGNFLIGNRMYSIHLRLVSDSTIKNNTMVESERGIYSEFSSNLLVRDNYLLRHEVGMLLDSSENNMISNCSFSGNGYGIMVETSSFRRVSSGNRIMENILTSNQGGVYVHMSRENYIQFNEVSNNSVFGVLLKSSKSNWIMRNNVSGNSEGIHLVSSWENFIVQNILMRNERGVNLELSSLNKIYLNSFLDNKFQMVSLESDNFWNDDLSGGNFWGDYEGSDDGSGGRIAGDGIGDTLLPQLGVDNYPLMKPPET